MFGNQTICAARRAVPSLPFAFKAVLVCLSVLVIFSTLWGGIAVQAQTLGDKFGGFSSASNEPINIAADELRVNDIKKTATFRGNVVAVQGNFELKSKVLEVFYHGSAQGVGQAAGGASGRVKRLVARGKVLISTKDKQSATSEWADFDVGKQVIVLGDRVVLTQGENIIRGGQLVINLKTRQSRFVNKTSKGRIQMKVDVKPKKKN